MQSSTIPTSFAYCPFFRGMPPYFIIPSDGSINPVIIFNKTLFPLPFLPTRPYIFPDSNFKFTFSNTVWFLKFFDTLSSSIFIYFLPSTYVKLYTLVYFLIFTATPVPITRHSAIWNTIHSGWDVICEIYSPCVSGSHENNVPATIWYIIIIINPICLSSASCNQHRNTSSNKAIVCKIILLISIIKLHLLPFPK